MTWKLHTTFSNVSLVKVFEFRFQFHLSLFPRVQLIIIQHCFKQRLGVEQVRSHYPNQYRPTHINGTRGKWNNQVREIFSLGFSTFCWNSPHPPGIHLKYSILYLKRCITVPSSYQHWLQVIEIHPRAISQNINKIWWEKLFLCICQRSMS